MTETRTQDLMAGQIAETDDEREWRAHRELIELGMTNYTDSDTALAHAAALADANGAPCLVLERDGWYCVSEEPLDDADPLYQHGWRDYALVDPDGSNF